ncbi:MAG TPA: hypothetical protein VEA69_02655 [Tepidisphaeraceae bacterium]|nr:hypothetical protein [Tepidisphaeraceae bacterium]
MPDAAAPDERFRHPSFWTGRWVRGLVVALVLLAGLRAAWGWSVERKVRAQWDAARQRGEATGAAEIRLSSPPTNEDAWPVVVRAIAALVPSVESPRQSNLEYTAYPPYGPKWYALAEAAEKAHGPAFATARQARSFPLARLRDKVDLSRNMPSADYNGARELSNLLVDGAQLAEVKGNHAEAVERLRDAWHVARCVRQDPWLVAQLVAMGIDSMVCNGALIIGPGLDLRESTPTGPATRAAVRGLIADLLAEQPDADAMVATMAAERLMAESVTRDVGGPRWVLHPLREAQMLRANAIFPAAADAVRRPDWPAARSARIDHPRNARGDEHAALIAAYGPDAGSAVMPVYHHWFDWAYPSPNRAVEYYFRGLAERRMTAAALAGQLFRADHSRWPASLAELAPAYLPAVPRDPFRADGGAIGYAVLPKALPGGGGDRPLLSSEYANVNTDYAARWREPFYEWSWRESADGKYVSDAVRQYRDLARFRPADVPIKEYDRYDPPDPDAAVPPPSPSPAEPVRPQPDEPGGPRQDKQE